jgi:hypothetical protein
VAQQIIKINIPVFYNFLGAPFQGIAGSTRPDVWSGADYRGLVGRLKKAYAAHVQGLGYDPAQAV